MLERLLDLFRRQEDIHDTKYSLFPNTVSHSLTPLSRSILDDGH